MHQLTWKNSLVDVVLLYETFLMDKTKKLVNIPGYNLIASNQKNMRGGGTAILLNNQINFTRQSNLEEFHEGQLETMYIKIKSKMNKSIVVSSLYRPPNTSEQMLQKHLSETIPRTKVEKFNKQVILGMDHNLDLLKGSSHAPTQTFLDLLLSYELLPMITQPTRITQQSATLIDNIYISEMLQRNFDSAIIINDMSDHLPAVALLKQTKYTDKSPIEFQRRKLNEEKISKINQKLHNVDWNGNLNSTDCNENFNKFCNLLQTNMDEVSPLVHIRISGKQRYSEPWMMPGIEISNRQNLKCYKETLKTSCTQELLTKYKSHRNILNRIKQKVKTNYYIKKCNEYKYSTKKLWQVINQTICKTKHKGSIIPFISIDGIKTYNPQKIANSFGSFYSHLGENRANNSRIYHHR